MSVKTCKNCGSLMTRSSKASTQQWTRKSFCSHKCSNSFRATANELPIETRFWKKVVKRKLGCWNWTGSTDKLGYGRMSVGARGMGHIKAHRVSWLIHYGEIPAGLVVAHACDNPNCVNPKHLLIGSQMANLVDMGKKGRVSFVSYKNLLESNK